MLCFGKLNEREEKGMLETKDVCGDIAFELNQMEIFAENSADAPQITYGFGQFMTIICCA